MVMIDDVYGLPHSLDDDGDFPLSLEGVSGTCICPCLLEVYGPAAATGLGSLVGVLWTCR